VVGLPSVEMCAPCITSLAGWVVHRLWVGWFKVWCRVRATGLQRVLVVGMLLCIILAIRDNLGGGKEGDGVAGSAVKGSGATNKDGGRVEWWVG